MSVITISRQFGAGGKTLGEIVAKTMGYTLVDEEIIQMVAKKAKVSTNFVQSIEKEAGGKLLKFMSRLVTKSYVDRILDERHGYIDEEIYVDLLNKIIGQIGDEGNAVVIGRGSQYILKDYKDTYHILLVADLEDRISFMEKKYKLSRSQAVQVVNSRGKRRANLYRKFGKQDFDQPTLYHMVLNMSKLDMNKASDLVCKLVRA